MVEPYIEDCPRKTLLHFHGGFAYENFPNFFVTTMQKFTPQKFNISENNIISFQSWQGTMVVLGKVHCLQQNIMMRGKKKHTHTHTHTI
jgi:hypothetical protein